MFNSYKYCMTIYKDYITNKIIILSTILQFIRVTKMLFKKSTVDVSERTNYGLYPKVK